MKIKWYISTLLFAFIAFGIYQNKISSPNQEILVQFGSDVVSIEQTQSAVASIKQQLKSFGIEVFQVRQSENGQLKIAYYSSVDVESVKKMLSEGQQLMLNYAPIPHPKNRIPSDKNSKKYNLDIYELHQSSDGHHGAAGTSVVIVKQDYDRFFNSNVFLPCTIIDASKINQLFREAYKVNRTIVLTIDKTSQAIPEVRAGPLKIGNV